MDRLEDLRAQWHRATEKDKPHDMIKALVELEKLDAHEPRWSQRLGEAYRRVGQMKDAVDAFARAFQRYFDRGFLPRAIAMAKLVKSLDAARGDLLEASLPKDGPGVPPPLPFGRAVGQPPPPATAEIPTRGAPPPPPKNVVKPPPLPVGDAPKPARGAPLPPPAPPARPATVPAPLPEEPLPILALKQPSVKPPPLPAPPVKPAPLTRADDSTSDEVRFVDAPDSSIEILLVDFNTADSAIVIGPDDDDGPPTRQLGEQPAVRDELALDTYATMATFRLFASLSRDALVALSNAAELVEFVPGAMIIVRDERAFALYAIVSGTARVIVTGANTEIRLNEGDIFGESSLLDEGQRQADVRAETPLMTLRIEKRALDEVVKQHPDVEAALFDLLARRLITNLMHTSPLFAAFEPAVRLELAQKFEVRRASAGTVIAERGRRSDGLYVLLAGVVMGETEGESPKRIARGAAFGHSSLLGSGSAEATVRAATEAVLLRMPAAGFGALAALYPPALAHLAETAHDPLPMSRREP
jgi:CRP-like cAMP-binding protein